MFPDFFKGRRGKRRKQMRHPIRRPFRSWAPRLETLEPRRLMEATAWTDKLDYQPGDLAVVYADGLTPGEWVRFQVLHADGHNGGNGHEEWFINDGGQGDWDHTANGRIQTTWRVDEDDSDGATFILDVETQTSRQIVNWIFTDNVPGGPNGGNGNNDNNGNSDLDNNGNPNNGNPDNGNPNDAQNDNQQGQFFGHVFTTTSDGQTVNQNLFSSKSDVYLNGGPQNENSNGLPDGVYYFQVTNPNGDTLLSTDDAINRQVVVLNGVVTGAYTTGVPAPHPNGQTNPNNGSTGVQLFPFDDTPNNGGEYKVWLIRQTDSTSVDPDDPRIIHFDQNDSKTDNFKVEIENPDPGPLPGSISGHKFEDLNGDGIANGDDATSGLGGFVIFVDVNGNGLNDQPEFSTLTAADGSYTIGGIAPGTYNVYEVNQSGYTQTLGTAGISATVTAGQDATGIDFLNFANILITGHKFYDANANGQDDTNQVVEGIKVGLDTSGDGVADYFAYTDANGNYVFGDLDNADGDNNATTGSDLGPGDYKVYEILPTGGEQWIQTAGNDGYAITAGGDGVQSGGVSTGNNFGNACLDQGGGHTLGFWSNKNGQGLTTASDIANLNTLNLKNADGSDLVLSPTLSTAKTQFRTWILGANATNMANMLSAQMAAMQLNVNHGITGAGNMVYVPGLNDWSNNGQGTNLLTNINSGPYGPVTNGLGFVSVADLIAKSNQILGSTTPNGSLVLSGSSVRKYEEALKIVLDGLNNNLAITVCLTPCPVVYSD